MTSSLNDKSFYLPLDDRYYNLDEEEKTFFKKETGIQDDAELKKHIIAVQIKAFSIYPFPSIRLFDFARLQLGRLPAYDQLIKLGKERKYAILIDLGCCFGSDIRKAIQDGYPVQNTLSSDLRKSLWELGHELFKSTSHSFPASFIEGDVLNPSFLSAVPSFAKGSPPTTAALSLNSITSLNDLRGSVSAVYTGQFFHLFSETQQDQIAWGLASLLSPEPGSMILGMHAGRSIKGFWAPGGSDFKTFCHSPESWKELWERIFGVGCVEVKAELKPVGGDSYFDMYPDNKDPFHMMMWSLTRL
ncbi:hypothetical protein BT96DRAFT_975162 [Gymnopus androsaceus JB14]|uniref:Methyltransferase domain-containing protein n=1 Tax=Gymnopus androsaceus JB14 TaxID=1447944 RepID=A0A6A4HVD1_9AGAR|nr:hypothetical protein BT96DRAFT_975162 [Gymnopus androsaceus JB14]